MPNILKTGPYRVFFYSSNGVEPCHVHIVRENKTAKFWLNPLRLESNQGFSRTEIGRIHKILGEHHLKLVEAWDAFFTDRN